MEYSTFVEKERRQLDTDMERSPSYNVKSNKQGTEHFIIIFNGRKGVE